MHATPDSLSRTLAALADPTRRAILARLKRGPATVKQLAAPFAMSGPAISKHLRVLERAGLIAQGREAQWRPRSLQAEPLKAVAEWTGGFAPFWDASAPLPDARLDSRDESREGSREGSPSEPPILEAQGDGYSA